MGRTLWGALCEVPDRRGLQGQQYKLQSLLSHQSKETLMTNDKTLATTDLERSIAEVKKLAEQRGLDFTFGDMRHFTGANAGASVGTVMARSYARE
jgi:hypothetical protein